MVQVPAVMNVRTPPEVMVHTPLVDEENATVRLEVAVADNVGDVPKFCAPGSAKVMTCGEAGVTLLDALDAPPVPALLVAVTVKV